MSRGSGVELEEQPTKNLSKDTDKVEIVSKALKYYNLRSVACVLINAK